MKSRMMLTFMLLLLLGALVVNGNPTEPFSLALVGGASQCQGELRVQRAGHDWVEVTPADFSYLSLGDRICAEMNCGSALSLEKIVVPRRDAAVIRFENCNNISVISCFNTEPVSSPVSLKLNCSDSVRLDGGRSLCSGSLEFKGQSWGQSWTEVCEGALDRRGAEVLCRELGCGAPVLQGPLSPLRQRFHCEGNESALIDCSQTDIQRETCSALQLTCAEPVRLVDGLNRCEGTLELNYEGEWKRVAPADLWTLETASDVCRDLDCGSAIFSEELGTFPETTVWFISVKCAKAATVRDCLMFEDMSTYKYGLKVACSGLLKGPYIAVSDGVSGADLQGPRVPLGSPFWVNCSVESQFAAGNFSLLAPTGYNQTLLATNQSAHFLFANAGPAHKGDYKCFYILRMYNRDLTFESSSLQLQPTGRGETNQAAVLTLLMSLLLGVAAGHMI